MIDDGLGDGGVRDRDIKNFQGLAKRKRMIEAVTSQSEDAGTVDISEQPQEE
jgi:hypothetical protein